MADTSKRSRVLLLGSEARTLLNFRGPLIRDLVAAGHAVIACAPDMPHHIRSALVELGATVVETPMSRTGSNPLRDIAYARRLVSLMRAERPDLVLTYTIKPNIWGAIAARITGVPSVSMVTGLGYAFTATPDGSAFKRFRQIATGLVARGLYRAATWSNRRVVFQNRDDVADFVAAGCLADTTKVILTNGSGVDTSSYAEAELPDAPVFLMVSRLLGNKGVREYARAARIVRDARPDARFQLVGYVDMGPDGVAPGEIEDWVADGVEYLGPRDDVRPAIAAASVCVLPSYREGTPRALLEAMAMGRAVVTSDAPGCRETVVDGRNGLLAPPRDADALARQLLVLADDASRRRTMGRASREIALERFDGRKVNATLLRDLDLAA